MLAGVQRPESIPLLPTIAKSLQTGEELFLYLVVFPVVVSVALVREKDRVQKPMYYTSRVL